MQRDRLDDIGHGQRVHKTFHLGDLFVVNHGDPESDEQKALTAELERFIDAITGRDVVRPRPAERGMHAAWVASLRSACLSRQVGAAIMDSRGELIAVGRNDPPAYGGGLYGDGDDDGTELDLRYYRWPNNEVEKPYCRYWPARHLANRHYDSDRDPEMKWMQFREQLRREDSQTDLARLCKMVDDGPIALLGESPCHDNSERCVVIDLMRRSRSDFTLRRFDPMTS